MSTEGAKKLPAQGLGPNCRLAEIVQYDCTLGKDRIICQPLERIFRLCAGRPAVEVTHVVEYDRFGKASLPAVVSNAVPRSHHWSEIQHKK